VNQPRLSRASRRARDKLQIALSIFPRARDFPPSAAPRSRRRIPHHLPAHQPEISRRRTRKRRSRGRRQVRGRSRDRSQGSANSPAESVCCRTSVACLSRRVLPRKALLQNERKSPLSLITSFPSPGTIGGISKHAVTPPLSSKRTAPLEGPSPTAVPAAVS